jgi:pentatricopeptide repeat protein
MSIIGHLRWKSSQLLPAVAYRTPLDFLIPNMSPVERTQSKLSRSGRAIEQGMRRAHESRRRSHSLEDVFVTALVLASTCTKHKYKFSRWTDRVSSNHNRKGDRRSFSNNSSSIARSNYRAQPHGRGLSQTAITKAQLVELIDPYANSADLSQGLYQAPEQYKGLAVAAHDPKAYAESQNRLYEPPSSDDHASTILQLASLLDSEDSSHDRIFEQYQKLPYPRATYLPGKMITSLLHHLSVVQEKDRASMLRYLSVVDDLKASNMQLSLTEWNSAIAFAGRCMKKVSMFEVQSAMQIWREMEKEAGIQGDFYTFNILFDTATKAGKFSLAATFFKEMQARKIPFSRHFKTSLIHFHGLRKDGDGIRKAYRDLVESDHVVDTIVLNTVIASLIQASEASVAEQVFLRMKRLQQDRKGARKPFQHWRERRKLGKEMSDAHFSKILEPKGLKRLHEIAPLGPDITTYRLILGHHTKESGNIDRVIELLDEMSGYGFQADGAIFYYLFRGFSEFGGVPYSTWTSRRLDLIWDAFKRALDGGLETVRLEPGIASTILSAVSKCADMKRFETVQDEIRARWELGQDERIQVVVSVQNRTRGDHVQYLL